MNFEAVIWDKTEHWTFTVQVTASSEAEAYKILLRDFPRKHYSIRSIV